MTPRNDTRFRSATLAASVASMSKNPNIRSAVGVIAVRYFPVDFAASDHPPPPRYVTT